jgi:WD40 repeat protein
LYEVAWSPNSAHIASGGSDAVISLWDIATRDHAGMTQHVPRHLLRGHKKVVWGIAWSPDGRWLASCSEDNTIRIWDAVKGVSERVIKEPELVDAQLFSTAWSPDSKRFAVASHRLGVLVYDMHTQALQRVGQFAAPPRTRCAEWSPDGRYLAFGGETGLVLIWNMDDNSLCATLDGQRGMVTALAWSADGTRLASGSWGRGNDQLLIWDTQSWNRVLVIDDPNECVNGAAWSADGSRLVSAGDDGNARWWNPQTGELLLLRQAHQGPVQSLRASPDSQYIASCGDDGAIQIFEMDGGEPVTTLRRDRPYERLDITGIKGLTDAQKIALKMLGAVE